MTRWRTPASSRIAADDEAVGSPSGGPLAKRDGFLPSRSNRPDVVFASLGDDEFIAATLKCPSARQTAE